MNKSMKIITDHDGTFSDHDIGRDFLAREFSRVYEFLGIDGESPPQQFVNAVVKIREQPEIINKTLGRVIAENGRCRNYNPRTDHGVELALMTVLEYELSGGSDDLSERFKEKVPGPDTTLRRYARELICNAPFSFDLHVCSAGIEDCVRKPYEELKLRRNPENIYLEVVGTEILRKEGESRWVVKPVGKYHKAYELARILNGNGGDGIPRPFVACGDTSGDSGMMMEAYGRGGVPISIGEKAKDYATIVVDDGDGFYSGSHVVIAAYAVANDSSDSRSLYRDIISEMGLDGKKPKVRYGNLRPRKIDKEIISLINGGNT